MSAAMLGSAPESLKLAREYAILGNYDASAIAYEGIVQQLVQYVAVAAVVLPSIAKFFIATFLP
jgi:hypothetical protein